MIVFVNGDGYLPPAPTFLQALQGLLHRPELRSTSSPSCRGHLRLLRRQLHCKPCFCVHLIGDCDWRSYVFSELYMSLVLPNSGVKLARNTVTSRTWMSDPYGFNKSPPPRLDSLLWAAFPRSRILCIPRSYYLFRKECDVLSFAKGR